MCHIIHLFRPKTRPDLNIHGTLIKCAYRIQRVSRHEEMGLFDGITTIKFSVIVAIEQIESDLFYDQLNGQNLAYPGK